MICEGTLTYGWVCGWLSGCWVSGWVCGWLGRSVSQWMGSGQITKNLINLGLIEIIQFWLMDGSFF